MSRRVVTILGLGAAGATGYYLYNAGGDPKVAEKKFEADASKLSSKVKNDIPGKGKEAEKKGEQYASQAGQKLDSTVDQARAKAAEAEKKAEAYSKDGKAKFEQYSKETGKNVNTAIDKFDKTVEKKASEAKSGISSWFGGK